MRLDVYEKVICEFVFGGAEYSRALCRLGLLPLSERHESSTTAQTRAYSARFFRNKSANCGSLILLGKIIRSITVGKDECYVVHLLHRVIVSIWVINVHLKYVHAGTRDGVYVGFCFHRWEEKLLCS
jgi:hypothetical protein